jgi:hypothetical protein
MNAEPQRCIEHSLHMLPLSLDVLGHSHLQDSTKHADDLQENFNTEPQVSTKQHSNLFVLKV